jgi:hypothetical protein
MGLLRRMQFSNLYLPHWVYSVSSFGWQKIVHVRTLNYPRPIPPMLEIPPDEKARG